MSKITLYRNDLTVEAELGLYNKHANRSTNTETVPSHPSARRLRQPTILHDLHFPWLVSVSLSKSERHARAAPLPTRI